MVEFNKEPSPHIFKRDGKTRISVLFILALLPSAVFGVYNFGLQALWIILVAIGSALITEGVLTYVRKKTFKINYSSSIITGLLLSLIIPPSVPLWIPMLGSFLALALAKHVFGGVGMTIFNPALTGRAILQASFPLIMTTYFWPDGVTSASPLELLKNSGYDTVVNYFGNNLAMYKSLFFGNIAGSIGETSALALLIGGLFLILVKVIDWRIPLVYIGTVGVIALTFGHDPLLHILSGGLIIGGFFIATSYQNMPINKSGRVYFAIGCGILTMAIRLWGGYPEGANYAILIMNAFSPFIERITLRKPFGYKKEKK